MSDLMVIGVMVAVFLALLFAGHYIHSVLLVAGVGGLILLDGMDILTGLLGPQPFARTASYTLTTIPLFVLMAQFILHADIVKDIFYVVNRVARNSKGVLGSLTLVAGAMLGAVSGSGTATAASLGQVAVPELEENGYKAPFAGAVSAAAGSLSGIVPPSIILILYGVATETPVGALFMAAVIPGILVTVVFIAIMVVCLRRARVDPTQLQTESVLIERIPRTRLLVSVAVTGLIVLVVFGGIYSGAVTPTEAGAVGAFAAFVAALVLGKVSMRFLRVTLTETVKVTVMVMLILIGAQVFGRFVSLSLIPRRLIELLEPIVETPVLMLTILALIFFVLFMFIEGAAVILMSVPVVLPIIEVMGTDVLWFGVFIAVLATVGLITPPVGLSVYAVSGATGIAARGIFRYSLVFAAVAALVVCGLMVAFPGVATWLPELAG
ncbi:TRAP transporter large permease [Aeromicrobium sp. CTD01-1L150]|uniref:TRAP transporter large permease n=1 Tax=Aeromicrobium sp. CTD01-1L150 TaxID=3341830 RepID=UPI0035BF7406